MKRTLTLTLITPLLFALATHTSRLVAGPIDDLLDARGHLTTYEAKLASLSHYLSQEAGPQLSDPNAYFVLVNAADATAEEAFAIMRRYQIYPPAVDGALRQGVVAYSQHQLPLMPLTEAVRDASTAKKAARLAIQAVEGAIAAHRQPRRVHPHRASSGHFCAEPFFIP